jgi:hypothetical protein
LTKMHTLSFAGMVAATAAARLTMLSCRYREFVLSVAS